MFDRKRKTRERWILIHLWSRTSDLTLRERLNFGIRFIYVASFPWELENLLNQKAVLFVTKGNNLLTMWIPCVVRIRRAAVSCAIVCAPLEFRSRPMRIQDHNGPVKLVHNRRTIGKTKWWNRHKPKETSVPQACHVHHSLLFISPSFFLPSLLAP